MGWMVSSLFLHFLHSLRKHKPPALCSVLLSHNYMIIKGCSRDIKGSTNLAYSKNVNLEVPSGLPFKAFPCSLARKSPQNVAAL